MPSSALRPAPPAAAAAAPPAPAARPVLVLVALVVVASFLVLLVLVLLGLQLGLERRGHEGVVLGAQVLLVAVAAGAEGLAVAIAGGVRRGELVLALERADVPHRHLELMSDPGVGSALADPGPDLVQLWLQRSPCQRAPETTKRDSHCADGEWLL